MLTPVLPFPRPGFVVEHVATADATRLMAARARTPAATCQHCPPRSARLPALAPCHAQRTGRLTATVRGLGRAAGGAVGTRMPTRLRMPWRGETMRRMLRRPLPAQPTPRGLGLDDCALRPGRVSGTILVALEQPRPVEFLPERTAETVATWLQEHQVSKSWPATGPRTTPEAQQRGRRWPRRWPIVCTYSVTSARYSRTHLG